MKIIKLGRYDYLQSENGTIFDANCIAAIIRKDIFTIITSHSGVEVYVSELPEEIVEAINSLCKKEKTSAI